MYLPSFPFGQPAARTRQTRCCAASASIHGLSTSQRTRSCRRLWWLLPSVGTYLVRGVRSQYPRVPLDLACTGVTVLTARTTRTAAAIQDSFILQTAQTGARRCKGVHRAACRLTRVPASPLFSLRLSRFSRASLSRCSLDVRWSALTPTCVPPRSARLHSGAVSVPARSGVNDQPRPTTHRMGDAADGHADATRRSRSREAHPLQLGLAQPASQPV
jgi:hypothetical protein